MITRYLTGFLEQEVRKTGLNKVVIGLSGGIDSAVVAVLAHRVFGDDLLCVKMPSHYSSQSSLADADELCRVFGLRSETRSIEGMLRAYETADMSPLRIGNLSARLRMAILFDLSARDGALVLGTSNKSELMLGYGTLYGDLASAINPIGDLYKTEVFELARYLEIPDSILGLQGGPAAEHRQLAAVRQQDGEDHPPAMHADHGIKDGRVQPLPAGSMPFFLTPI